MPRSLAWVRRPWVWRLVTVALSALGVVFLVVPQFREGAEHLDVLSDVHPGWVVAGIACEMLSFVAYGLFTRAVLPAKGRPSWHWLLRVDMIGSGLTHVLPGGGAAASGVRFHLLRKGGVRTSDAAFGSVLQGLLSAIVVNLLLLLGVLVVVPTRGVSPIYGLGAAVGVVLVGVFVALCVTFTRGEEHAVALVGRLGARFGRAAAFEALARRVSERMAAMRDPRLMAQTVAWATANWLFDAASLWVFLLAFGHRVDIGAILVAFGLANTLAVLPITPGGLGVVEGVLIPLLVGFGTPKGVAVLGVLAWRLFNFWAPIPVGGLSWLSIHLGLRRRRRPALSAA